MLREFRPALTLIAAFTLLCGLILPLGMTYFAGLALPYQAGGSLLRAHGQVIGSALIGQDFTGAGYFHSRPSALTGTDPKNPARLIPTPYDASESGASNLGPTSKQLQATVLRRVARQHAAFGPSPVPPDAVTASASGLDPDISPQNARRQVARVAASRHIAPAALMRLVAAHTRGRLFGIFGQPRVNVLRLNLALAKEVGAGMK